MATDNPIAITLAAGKWSLIDGTIDNLVDGATVDGDEDTSDTGRAIRRAGWAQVPWQADGSWPPMADEITISLTRTQWTFARDAVADSQASYERLGMTDSVEQGRAVINVISSHLA